MSLILNIETSAKACSVALSNNGNLVSGRTESAQDYSHSRSLHVFIQQLLKETGTLPQQLKAVAVSQGPGSYTGLRIGYGAAKGLCFALEIPLIEISTLALIAFAASEKVPDAGIFIPMIDARRMEVYTQTFNAQLHPVNTPVALVLEKNSFESLKDTRVVLCGDGCEKTIEWFGENPNWKIAPEIVAQAQDMCTLSHKKFTQQQFANVNYCEPFYLKEFQSQSAFHKK